MTIKMMFTPELYNILRDYNYGKGAYYRSSGKVIRINTKNKSLEVFDVLDYRHVSADKSIRPCTTVNEGHLILLGVIS